MTENRTPELDHGRQLQEMIRGYRQAQVLMTCVSLGVFEALAGGGKEVPELATSLSVDADALQRLLNAATGLGLLEKAGDVYTNAPAAVHCLAHPGSDGYLGHLFRREDAFYERWGRLPKAVRTGQRPEPNLAMEDTGDWVRDFEYALYDLARLYGPAVAEALDLPADRPLRVLDVGGGHGGYSIALARRYPRLEAVVLDLPPVIEVTREIVGNTEVADRVHPQAGDFLEDELGSGYDLALIFGVLLSEPPDRRQKLLRRVHTALKPDGLLALRESVLDNDGMGAPEVLLFDLQMLLSTEDGGALKRSTLMHELETAGFGNVETKSLDLAGTSPIWLARRT